MLLLLTGCSLSVDFPGAIPNVAHVRAPVDTAETGVELPDHPVGERIPLDPLETPAADLDLDEVLIGCQVRIPVFLQNPTVQDMTVVEMLVTRPTEQVTLETARFGPMPWTIAPGDEVDPLLVVDLVEEGPLATAYLFVLEPDALGELRMDLRAYGVSYAVQEQVFHVGDDLSLAALPVVATLHIQLDGALMEEGVRWYAKDNRLILDTPLEGDQELVVRYSERPPECP